LNFITVFHKNFELEGSFIVCYESYSKNTFKLGLKHSCNHYQYHTFILSEGNPQYSYIINQVNEKQLCLNHIPNSDLLLSPLELKWIHDMLIH